MNYLLRVNDDETQPHSNNLRVFAQVKILGYDLTSAPTVRKTITCAEALLVDHTLSILAVHSFATFAEFEQSIAQHGPFVAGFDFPFSQPRRLIENLGWPTQWEQLISHVVTIGKQGFESAIRDYMRTQPVGDKLHCRRTDDCVNALSPMKLDYVPVGKMFFQGAPRLLAAGLNILPCHPRSDTRVALEVYPSLVNRYLNRSQSYKNDNPRRHTVEHAIARTRLLASLNTPEFTRRYDLTLKISSAVQSAALDDQTGDILDAILCAVQAAWASAAPNFGIPPDCDPLEGWIVDTPQIT